MVYWKKIHLHAGVNTASYFHLLDFIPQWWWACNPACNVSHVGSCSPHVFRYMCVYSLHLSVRLCVCLTSVGSEWEELKQKLRGEASKSAKWGTQQRIGDTFDAVRKINQNNSKQRAHMENYYGPGFWLLASWLQPHKKSSPAPSYFWKCVWVKRKPESLKGSVWLSS